MRALLLIASLMVAPSLAAADVLPSCPPGQMPDCTPTESRHGCGGCKPIPSAMTGPEAEPQPEAESQPSAMDEPGGGSASGETSGGCAVSQAGAAGGLAGALLVGLALSALPGFVWR